MSRVYPSHFSKAAFVKCAVSSSENKTKPLNLSVILFMAALPYFLCLLDRSGALSGRARPFSYVCQAGTIGGGGET